MKVFCISGKAGAGKDTIATMLQDEFGERGKRVLVIHYADLLKWMCSKFFGWDGKKDDKGRTLLQQVGTEGVRAKEPDFWVEFVAKVLTFFPDSWDVVLIPDCRFPNEVNYLRGHGFDCTHLRVERPGYNILSEEQQQHASERALDGFPVDVSVVNDATLWDLRNNVRHIVDSFC